MVNFDEEIRTQKGREAKMQIKNKSIKLGIAALLVLLCLSCEQTTILHQYKSIPQEGWSRENILNFEIEIDSTELKSDINIELSYNNNYPYSNLYLFVSAKDTAAKSIFSDTLNITLADEYGKWLGDGWGASYQQVIEYKDIYGFPLSGVYNISIKQGMRDNPILGIERVGIKIEREEE